MHTIADIRPNLAEVIESGETPSDKAMLLLALGYIGFCMNAKIVPSREGLLLFNSDLATMVDNSMPMAEELIDSHPHLSKLKQAAESALSYRQLLADLPLLNKLVHAPYWKIGLPQIIAKASSGDYSTTVPMNSASLIASELENKLKFQIKDQDTNTEVDLPTFGPWKYEDGSTYQGQYRMGLREGQGRLVTKDGSIYEGQFKQDKRHGLGAMYSSFGCGYIGEWQNGKKHGRGTHYYSTGHNYQGVWKNGIEDLEVDRPVV